ncbi:MAG: heme o synthase [Salibacteraceae bacterium]
MISKSITSQEAISLAKSKAKDVAVLTKMRLASLVVFSAFLGYLLAASSIVWVDVLYLVLGGFLVTGSSNAFNQIMERDIDKEMARTADRPLPTSRMGVQEAFWIATFTGIIGIVILWFGLNPLSGILGALALFMYVFLYTPLKKVGPIAAYVGAFPGAVPPMLGYVAVTGSFDMIAGLLFAVQFAWQFPHFWSIAWKLNDDYTKVGYYLLPSRNRDKKSSLIIAISGLLLVPVSLLPMVYGVGGIVSGSIVGLMGLMVFYLTVKLHLSNDQKDATRLMFGTFIYLPVVQLSYLLSL